jgi:uncharacterized protein (TIGR03083 family)
LEFDAKTYADFLRRDSAAFADAARDNLAARVPSCPDWTVEQLVAHLIVTHFFWRLIAERHVQDRRELEDIEPPTPSDPVEYFLDNANRFADLLQAEDPETPVWTWSKRKNIGFIQRRMAHETAVHRWDAQFAARDPQPIAGDLAADGVDEFLEHFLEAKHPVTGNGESIHMHRTDGEGEWLIRLSPDGARVSHGHEKGDAAVRGSASDLLLLLWGRLKPDALEVFGDRDVLDRLLTHADLD